MNPYRDPQPPITRTYYTPRWREYVRSIASYLPLRWRWVRRLIGGHWCLFKLDAHHHAWLGVPNRGTCLCVAGCCGTHANPLATEDYNE